MVIVIYSKIDNALHNCIFFNQKYILSVYFRWIDVKEGVDKIIIIPWNHFKFWNLIGLHAFDNLF